MKTVTAKEFQLNQSQFMKDAAKGTVFWVTFHGKPWVEVRSVNRQNKKVAKGSHEAFKQSLNISLKCNDPSKQLSYKELKKQYLTNKYGI